MTPPLFRDNGFKGHRGHMADQPNGICSYWCCPRQPLLWMVSWMETVVCLCLGWWGWKGKWKPCWCREKISSYRCFYTLSELCGWAVSVWQRVVHGDKPADLNFWCRQEHGPGIKTKPSLIQKQFVINPFNPAQQGAPACLFKWK